MNHTERDEIRALLQEAPIQTSTSGRSYQAAAPPRAQSARVEYYAVTPRKSRARFTKVLSLSQLRGSQSETAVYVFLKTMHAPCEIEIQRLEFR